MPSINLEFLNNLTDDYKKYTNFIETGTFRGETIFNMEPYFLKLYTIEVKEDLYNNVKKIYNGNKINFYLGDSQNILNEILINIKTKSVFFLDSHYGGGEHGRGTKDCPLYEELKSIILNHKDEAIIIIDDVRLFGKKPGDKVHTGKVICDWRDINIDNIINIVKDRLTSKYFRPSPIVDNDRFILHISQLN